MASDLAGSARSATLQCRLAAEPHEAYRVRSASDPAWGGQRPAVSRAAPATVRDCRARMRNLISDVAGVLVGNADDVRLGSGLTAIVFEQPAVAGVDLRGGAPG